MKFQIGDLVRSEFAASVLPLSDRPTYFILFQDSPDGCFRGCYEPGETTTDGQDLTYDSYFCRINRDSHRYYTRLRGPTPEEHQKLMSVALFHMLQGTLTHDQIQPILNLKVP